MKFISWNVNGIRSCTEKGFLDWFVHEDADVVCVQETKAHPDQLAAELTSPPGYTTYWASAEKKGYSGVATFSKTTPKSTIVGLNGTNQPPSGVEGGRSSDSANSASLRRAPAKLELDTALPVEGAASRGFASMRSKIVDFAESNQQAHIINGHGRTLVHDFGDFVLFNCYFPNSQDDLNRLPLKLAYDAEVMRQCDVLRQQGRSIIICGDFNVAHQPIDIKNAKSNEGCSGYTKEERAWMTEFLGAGYIDAFRHLHPNEPDHFTWWSFRTAARKRNVGWRIDYFVISHDLLPKLKRCWHLPEVFGSDHCPVGLELII